MVENDSNKFARAAWIGTPINSGDAESAQIHLISNQTDCNGNLDVTISNIDENKTATYVFGIVTQEPTKL
ncbi:MAG: hypothetical protein DSZ05_07535 [Sulfurospirillum sp.]|nr:MAG: hypothetical protein DSZ05_07535 [Sulfurospirillum sp.]